VADRPCGWHAPRRYRAGRIGERDLCGIGAKGGGDVRDEPGFRRVHHCLARGRCEFGGRDRDRTGDPLDGA
jgi:hypothetical protein